MKESFSVLITPAAECLLKKLPHEVMAFVREEFPRTVRVNPFVGKFLSPPLDPLRSFHFSISGQSYRIAYEVKKSPKIIIIYLVWHRGGFYERLRRLLIR